MFKNKKSQKGFTLIEILIVIGIIALLATIVIVAINPARQFAQARDTQRTSNVNAILNAIGQKIADDKGIIPTDITTDPLEIKSGAGGADLCLDLVPTYMPALVADPTVSGDGQFDASECEPADTYSTKYTVEKLDNNRIQVCTTVDETTLPRGTTDICVTR